MMKESENIRKRMIQLIGVAYLLLGVIVVLQSFRGITGFVIVEEVPQTIGWIFGLILSGIGIFLLMSGERSKESELIKKIENKESQILGSCLNLNDEEVNKLLHGETIIKYRTFGESKKGEVEEFYSFKDGKLGAGIIDIQAKNVGGITYLREFIHRAQEAAQGLGYNQVDIYGIAPVDKTKILLQKIGFHEIPQGAISLPGYETEPLWKKTISIHEKIRKIN